MDSQDLSGEAQRKQLQLMLSKVQKQTVELVALEQRVRERKTLATNLLIRGSTRDPEEAARAAERRQGQRNLDGEEGQESAW